MSQRRMHFLDLTLPTLHENLALDEALLLDAEAGGPSVLRTWSWLQYAVVLGAGSKLAEDVDEAACVADGVPIARRSSGGGTVLLGPGCLLYSLILSQRDGLADLLPSYRHILGEIAAAMADLARDTRHEGTSDIASAGRKFSGNAQQRKRTHFLHHGTLLYDFDLKIVSRYLRRPARQPEYRRGREHEVFLMNLPTSKADLIKRLMTSWRVLEPLCEWPREATRELAQEKYAKADWIKRR